MYHRYMNDFPQYVVILANDIYNNMITDKNRSYFEPQSGEWWLYELNHYLRTTCDTDADNANNNTLLLEILYYFTEQNWIDTDGLFMGVSV